MLFLRSSRWQTILDYKMLSLTDTLWVLLNRFVFVTKNIDFKSMVLGLHDLTWLRFLQPKQNFRTIWLLNSDWPNPHFLNNKCFWLLLWCSDPVQSCKAYIACLSEKSSGLSVSVQTTTKLPTAIVVYWPPTRPNMPFQKRRKRIFHWHRRTWLTIWDRVKIPWYSHRLMHQKRVTCELHDSYFHLMMIKHAIPKTAEVHKRLSGHWTII